MKVTVGKEHIIVSNPDKMLFPASGITKKLFVEYYHYVAPLLVPHLKERPITLFRFPDGVGKTTFFQKEAAHYYPDYIEVQPVEKTDGSVINYPLINNQAALVYCANLVSVLHVWLSKAPRLNYPDRMIFDLDPSAGVGFDVVKWTAQELRKIMEHHDLASYVMTTGSRGLHVVVPLKAQLLFDEVKECAQYLAGQLIEKYPARCTMLVTKSKRGKRVFIDTLRNAWSATAVAPYTIREKKDAPVATPLTWSELNKISSSQHYTIRTILKRIDTVGDLWKTINQDACSLKQIMQKIRNTSS